MMLASSIGNVLGTFLKHLPPISNIKHPLAGILYLLIIGFLFRSLWPLAWNDFLKNISAKSAGDIDVHPNEKNK